MKRLMSTASALILVMAILAIARPASKQLSIIALGSLPGRNTSVAADINKRGQIVGASTINDGAELRAVLWEDGNITNLGVLPGGNRSFARGHKRPWASRRRKQQGRDLLTRLPLGRWHDDRPRHAAGRDRKRGYGNKPPGAGSGHK